MTFTNIVVVVIFGILAVPVMGQLSGNIHPMQSNCNDVSHLLDRPTCKTSHEVYVLKDETIYVDYSTELCQRAYGIEWDVPLGTVLSVIRIPKVPVLLSSLSIDLSGCDVSPAMTDVKDTLRYTCEAFGMSISAQKNYIYEIIYVPTSKDFDLQCKKGCSRK